VLTLKNSLLRSIGHQHWLRGSDRLLRAFANPDTHPPTSFEVDFYGLRYSGRLSNFIDWNVLFYGAFAPEELELLGLLSDALRARGDSVNFYDVGANIGHHTLFMSRHADHIFSFEPFDKVRDEMARKLRHACVDNVSILPVAFGDKNGLASFTPPTGANQGTGTLSDRLPANASSETITVQVVTGDDFLAANQLPPVTLLKMDVEGFEVNALQGLQKTLHRDRPPILMELLATGDTEHRDATVLDLLYSDHLLFAVTSHHRRLVLGPFRRGESMEALVLPRELAGIIPGTGVH
jgi:FkbM family methyltransferase